MHIETTCYKTADGRLFESEEKAKAHAADLLGQELDGLLKLAKIDITRSQEYKALLQWMQQPSELKAAVKAIHGLLTFADSVEG